MGDAMTNDYDMHEHKAIPHILIVEDNTIEQLDWDRINKKYPAIEIECSDSPSKILVEWLELFADDYIPRVLICDWHLAKRPIGKLKRESPSGTMYDIDGAAFVLFQCMQAVGNHSGMFVAYTSDTDTARSETSKWPQDMQDRLHIINKDTMTCEELLAFVVEHEDYVKQETRNPDIIIDPHTDIDVDLYEGEGDING